LASAASLATLSPGSFAQAISHWSRRSSLQSTRCSFDYYNLYKKTNEMGELKMSEIKTATITDLNEEKYIMPMDWGSIQSNA